MSGPLYIDNSTMAAVAQCDTRAALRYVFGYTNNEESIALKCGSAVHVALEAYFKTGERKAALKAFRGDYEEWADANVPANPERHQLWLLKYSFQNVRDILKTWLRRHDLATEPYRVFPDLVEIGFAYPLDDTGDVLFYGRYDAIVEERASGQLMILDHKTTGQLSSDWAHTFKLSTQITGYTWAAMQLLGKRVTGAIINGLQISKLPDVKYKANGDAYKCREHGIGVDECRLAHTKDALAITQRDQHEIDTWMRDARRLAKKFAYLKKNYPDVASVSQAPQQGRFAHACRYCEFRSYCEVGRPAARVDEMLTFSPWKPYEPKEDGK